MQRNRTQFRRSRKAQRRGAMLVLVCLMLIVFLVAVVFSVDVAYMQLTRVKLRASTDAAARAAGEALSREQDMGAARAAARELAEANPVAGQPLLLDDEDIVFGNAVANSEANWIFTANASPVNSVRVNGRRTEGSLSGAVPTFFAALFGVDMFEPQQNATVVRLDRDICLVVDRSSSMKLYLTDTAPTMSTSDSRFCDIPHAESRWAALDSAVDVFIEALDDTPQSENIALVSYASSGTWCSSSNTNADVNQNLSSDHALIATAMDSLSSSVFNGATNITAGLNAGRGVLNDPASARPFAAKTLVLMTDGHYTTGGSPVPSAYEAAEEDIVIHTVTFGDGADQTLMRSVADATSGQHFHASDAAELEEVFREIAYTLPVVFID